MAESLEELPFSSFLWALVCVCIRVSVYRCEHTSVYKSIGNREAVGIGVQQTLRGVEAREIRVQESYREKDFEGGDAREYECHASCLPPLFDAEILGKEGKW